MDGKNLMPLLPLDIITCAKCGTEYTEQNISCPKCLEAWSKKMEKLREKYLELKKNETEK